VAEVSGGVSSGGTGNALAQVAGSFPPRVRRALNLLVAGMALAEVGKRRWSWLAARMMFVVTVPQEDRLYDETMDWLIGSLPENVQRSLKVRTTARSFHPGDDGRPTAVPEGAELARSRQLRVAYDSTLEQTVLFGRHRVKVSVTDETRNRGTATYQVQKIQFKAMGATARDLVLAKLGELADQLAAQSTRQAPKFFMCRQWGGFSSRDDLPARPLDTVVLPSGVLDATVADLDRFLAAEARYAAMGMPWHRGYLFHGPPGTGKTSTAIALAQAHNLNVFYMPLADLQSNGQLFDALRELTPRSVLLLEDIDVLGAASADRASTDGQPQVTLDGLLNALDGAATPHGLVVMMTSNRPDALDGALVRKGRVDVHTHFALAGGAHVLALLDRFAPGWETTKATEVAAHRHLVATAFDLNPVAPSVILECVKSNLDDPTAAGRAAFQLGVDLAEGASTFLTAGAEAEWYDPTHGRVDRDIQEYVDRMDPKSIAQRVAIENTLQARRGNRSDG